MAEQKAAGTGDLQALHGLVARSLSNRIRQDMEDDLPTDAATLGAAIKFLKDNNISADPADADDLQDLRTKLAEQAAARRAKSAEVVRLVQSNYQAMEA